MFILSAFIAVLVPRPAIAIIIKIINGAGMAVAPNQAPNLTTSMAIWPFPGSSPDLSSSIQCLQMFTDRLRCARDKHSRVDVQFAGKKPPRHALMYASKHATDTGGSMCSIMHAALHGIDRDRRVYVLFLDPLTPFIVPLQSIF
jgi:hypothetical protein